MTVSFKKFIAVAYHKYAMHYGVGETLAVAEKNCRRSARTKKLDMTRYMFQSDKPFAPLNRSATEQEADAWFAADLCLYWERCERIEL